MRRLLLLLVGLLALAAVAVASSGGATRAQPHWVIRDLGTLGRGDFFKYQGFSLASAINDQGQIVGWSWRTEDELWGGSGHAFLWEDGTMRDLGAFRGLPNSRARDINNEGQIVGESFTFPALRDEWSFDRKRSRAVLWEDGQMRTLPGSRARALGINDKGEIVGWVGGNEAERAALWQAGRLRVFGNPGSSEAVDLNERTQVVGMYGDWSFGDGAFWGSSGFLWENGTVHDLGSLARGVNVGWSSGVTAINDSGQIVGGRNDYATVWEGGVPRRLPSPSRAVASYASDINERGQIVGSWSQDTDTARPALWENGRLTLLPGLPGGRGEGEAWSINMQGQIVGWATTRSTYYSHAVLWTLKP
jgi:probable HAF family extracellular repeat protein